MLIFRIVVTTILYCFTLRSYGSSLKVPFEFLYSPNGYYSLLKTKSSTFAYQGPANNIRLGIKVGWFNFMGYYRSSNEENKKFDPNIKESKKDTETGTLIKLFFGKIIYTGFAVGVIKSKIELLDSSSRKSHLDGISNSFVVGTTYNIKDFYILIEGEIRSGHYKINDVIEGLPHTDSILIQGLSSYIGLGLNF